MYLELFMINFLIRSVQKLIAKCWKLIHCNLQGKYVILSSLQNKHVISISTFSAVCLCSKFSQNFARVDLLCQAASNSKN